MPLFDAFWRCLFAIVGPSLEHVRFFGGVIFIFFHVQKSPEMKPFRLAAQQRNPEKSQLQPASDFNLWTSSTVVTLTESTATK